MVKCPQAYGILLENEHYYRIQEGHARNIEELRRKGGAGHQPAWEPAQAGLCAGSLDVPAGMPAGLGRAGCRPPRRTRRHASRPRPGWVPGHPLLLRRARVSVPVSVCRPVCRPARCPGRHDSQLMPAGMPALPVFPATYLSNGYLVLEHINRPPPTSGQGSQAN